MKKRPSSNAKRTLLAVPAAALMLGAAQAGTTVGMNFAAWYYDSGTTPQTIGYGAGYQTTGFQVTAKAFGIDAANWYGTLSPDLLNGYYAAIDSTYPLGPEGVLSAHLVAPGIYQTGIGQISGDWVPQIVAAGNDQVTWNCLNNDGATYPSVIIGNLAATFPNGYVVQTIAAHDGTIGLNGVSFTDTITTTHADYQTYYRVANPGANSGYRSGGGTIGLSGPSGTWTSDTIEIHCDAQTEGNYSGMAGFIITDKPVVSLDPTGGTIPADSTLTLTAGAIGLPPLSYQWYQGATPVGTDSPTYTKTNATAEDSGTYTVVVKNTIDGTEYTATSQGAVVNVTVPAPVTWDADTGTPGAQDGDGTWDAATANWWDGAADIAWSNLNYATFGAGGTGSATVTLADNAAVSSLTFSDVEYTLTTTTGNTLTLADAAQVTTNTNTTIGVALAGTGGLIKTGSGILTLNKQNPLSGTTTVSEGSLNLPIAWGNSAPSLKTSVINLAPGTSLTCDGGAFGWFGNNDATGITINIDGATCQPNGAFGIAYTLTGGTITGTNRLDLGASGGFNTSITSYASSTTSVISSASILLRADSGQTTYPITVAAGTTPSGVDLDIPAWIWGGGCGIVKNGPGVLKLAANDYGGATVINEGKVILAGGLYGTSSVTINTGTTLDVISGDNCFGGDHATVWADARTITVDGGTFVMGSATQFRIGNITLTNGSTWTSNRGLTYYDEVLGNVTSGPATVTVSGTGPSLMNGTGGLHLLGVQNFAVEDTTGDTNADLIVSMILDNGGAMGGTGGVRKTGAGTMVLSAINSYTGDTTVEEGTLAVSGRLTGNGALTLKDNTTLDIAAGGATATITTTGDMNVGSTPGEATGTNTINFAGLSNTSVAPIGAGTLYFDNPVTINILNVAPVVGIYPLIHVTGDANINSLTLGTLPYGIEASLVNDTAGDSKSVYLNVTVVTELIWTGLTNGIWDTTTNNWTPVNYVDGASTRFDDSATTTDITLDTTVSPSWVTFNNNNNYTLSGSGTIAGYAGLLKQGSGPLALATPNTYTGGTMLDAGALHINHAQAIGDGGLVINGGALDNTSAAAITVTTTIPQAWNADVTFAGTNDLVFSAGSVTLGANRIVNVENGLLGIGGALNAASGVTLTKTGAGTLSIGSGNWNGLTTVTGGTLEVNGKANDVAYVVGSGATLKVGYSTGGGYANTNLKLTGDGVSATTGLYLKGGTAYCASGAIELLAAPTTIRQYGTGLAGIGTFDIGGNALTTEAASSGSVIDANIQMVNLGYGMSVNIAPGVATSTGDLVINGPLSVGSMGFYKRGAGSVLLNGVATTNNTYVSVHGGSVICGIDNCLGTNSKLDISSGNKLVLNGFNQTTGSLLANTGSIVGGSATTATLTLGQADAVTFPGVIGGTGTNENNLALTKAGASPLTLSGTNTYSGGTTVSQGSLAVTGLLTGSGPVTVADGAVLAVTGRLTGGGPLTVANGATLQVTAGGSNAAVVASTVALGSGAAMSLDFANLTSTSVAPLSASDLQVNSPVTVNIASVAMAVGQYPLVKFTGTKSGSGTFTLGTLPGYVDGSLVDDTAGPSKSVYLNVTGVIQLTWTGATDGLWDLATTNWKDALNAPVTYLNGAITRFDDNASLTDITLDTSLSTAEMIFTNAIKNYSLSGTGMLSCSAGLGKSGAGALTLLNDNTANTGTVSITGGSVTVGNDGTIGTLGGTGNITLSNATLVFNRSDAQILDRTIVGTGGTFIKDGSNTLTMSAANNTCDIVINNGTLAARGGWWDVSFAANRTITVNAPGILDTTTHALGGLGGAIRPNNIVVNEDAVWYLNNEQQLPNTALTLTAGILSGPGEIRGGGTVVSIAHATKSSVINCGINNGNGAATFNVANGAVDADLVVTGVISSGNGFTKTGDGKMVLSGGNTYTGNTTVIEGTLELASTGVMKFVVTNTANNKITGAGTATLDGSFNIDTSAVTATTGSWTLVDVATQTYGGTFNVPGFTGSGSLWTKVVTPTTWWIFDTASGKLYLSGPAEILSLGIPGSIAVIDQTARTIALTVPWEPWGTGLETLNPTFTLSSGTCNQTSGSPPSPTFAVGNPATYIVEDAINLVTNTYTVTVNVTPISTAKIMSNVYFTGYGYAWATSATEFLILVPSSAPSVLAPTYSVSEFATGSPVSGTSLNFTTPQTYTVTAQDGSTQAYTVTVQKITATGSGSYQQKVLASGPVSYWPLNETSGTTAFDIAAGLNNATYSGIYTLGVPGQRADGNLAVDFPGTAAGQAAIPYTPSLNPKQFTVEFWCKPNNTSAAYVVAEQDRTTGRMGWAIQKNNFTSGWDFTFGTSPADYGTISSGTSVVVGQVYYVVASYDGTTARLYENGVLVNSVVTPYQPASATALGVSMGSRNGNATVNGVLQDVAIYTRALTSAEIQNHYQSTAGYGTWATTNAGGQTPGEDYDNDGVQNGVEYFMGATGSSFTAMPGLDGTNTVTWPKSATFSGTWQVQTSPDLATWTNVTGTDNGTSVSYTLPEGSGKLFVRLVVTPN